MRSIPKASADATYGAILLIEPLRQFEALGAAVAVPLLEQYLRDLGRCAGGLVPVYGVTGDMKLARLVARGWAALESAWASKRAAAAQEAAGARQRSARDEVRSSNCIICLDGGPSMTLVCCGGAFHMRCLSVWLASSTTCPQCRAVVPPEERPAPPPPAGRPNPGRVVQLFNGDPDDTTFIDDTTYEPSDDTTDFEPAEDTTEEEFEFDDSTVFDLQFATVEDDTTAEEEGATEDDTTEVAA